MTFCRETDLLIHNACSTELVTVGIDTECIRGFKKKAPIRYPFHLCNGAPQVNAGVVDAYRREDTHRHLQVARAKFTATPCGWHERAATPKMHFTSSKSLKDYESFSQMFLQSDGIIFRLCFLAAMIYASYIVIGCTQLRRTMHKARMQHRQARLSRTPRRRALTRRMPFHGLCSQRGRCRVQPRLNSFTGPTCPSRICTGVGRPGAGAFQTGLASFESARGGPRHVALGVRVRFAKKRGKVTAFMPRALRGRRPVHVSFSLKPVRNTVLVTNTGR